MYKMAGIAHLAKPAHFLRNGVAMVSRFRSTQVMGKVTIINSHVSREHTPTEYTFSFCFLRRCVESSDVIRWLSFCVMERRYSVLSNESDEITHTHTHTHTRGGSLHQLLFQYYLESHHNHLHVTLNRYMPWQTE